MVAMRVEFVGEKTCQLTHGPSSTIIRTDAPIDNGGKGAAFSPTDLLGAALGSCILTTMQILAEKEGRSIQLAGATAEITKEMSGPPRRVSRLQLKLRMPSGIPVGDREFLKAIVHECPVARSLHPSVVVDAEVIFPD